MVARWHVNKKSVAAHALVKKSIGSVVIKLPLKLMIVKKAANLARVCTTAASPPPLGASKGALLKPSWGALGAFWGALGPVWGLYRAGLVTLSWAILWPS